MARFSQKLKLKPKAFKGLSLMLLLFAYFKERYCFEKKSVSK
jgi:hypothetical protein